MTKILRNHSRHRRAPFERLAISCVFGHPELDSGSNTSEIATKTPFPRNDRGGA